MTDSVTICIPTCGQPNMLKRLLDTIAAQETKAVISVLVADHDTEGRAGMDLCLAMDDYPWPLTAVMASHCGIAQVRNVLIEYALMTGASFIAMIDDDQWPEKDWLEQILACAHTTGADLLQGAILFDRDMRGHGDIRHPSGPIAMPLGAGNLLMRRALLEDMAAPWFDPRAAAHSEEQDFFFRLRQAGKRFAWCDEARAHSQGPEGASTSRTTARHRQPAHDSQMRRSHLWAAMAQAFQGR